MRRVELASRKVLKTKNEKERDLARKGGKKELRGWLILYTAELTIRLPERQVSVLDL